MGCIQSTESTDGGVCENFYRPLELSHFSLEKIIFGVKKDRGSGTLFTQRRSFGAFSWSSHIRPPIW